MTEKEIQEKIKEYDLAILREMALVDEGFAVMYDAELGKNGIKRSVESAIRYYREEKKKLLEQLDNPQKK